MRKKNTIYNSIAGLINKIATIAFVFILRRCMKEVLGDEYIGLEGLFVNVIGVFSLVDLGIGSAIAFNLYKPIHENNRKLLNAILWLYREIYVIAGALMIVLSIGFSFIIPNLIKDGTIASGSVSLYFFIYTLGVAVTYFFSYKRTVLFAIQKNYRVLFVDTIVKIVISVLQLHVITKYRSYLLYLAIIVVLNLVGNIIISCILKKYDVYDENRKEEIPESFKSLIIKHIKALAVTNIAWQGITSTDNIIISAVVGVVDLAKNSVYSSITMNVDSLVSFFAGGVSASIGDLIAENNPAKIKEYFNRYCYIYAIISSYAALGVFFISKPLIEIWLGGDLIFEKRIVLVLAINVVLALNFRPLADYQNYTGNFTRYRPYSVIALFINIVSSIVLGKICGVIGVFIGTTITYLFMSIVIISIIYRYVFECKETDYYLRIAWYYLPLLVSFLLITFLGWFSPNNAGFQILYYIGIITIVYFLIVFLVLFKNKEFQYFIWEIREFICKFIRKDKK